MILALQQEGKENPGLVRAMSDLGDGCGFFQETCGIMTGAASLLSWYAGKGTDSGEESEKLLPMLQDLGDWFQQEIGAKYNGTRCKDIEGDLVGTPEVKQICGGIIPQTYRKVPVSSWSFSEIPSTASCYFEEAHVAEYCELPRRQNLYPEQDRLYAG